MKRRTGKKNFDKFELIGICEKFINNIIHKVSNNGKQKGIHLIEHACLSEDRDATD
jgi:hypothetical protein